MALVLHSSSRLL